MRKFPFLRLMILFGVIGKTVPTKLKLNLTIDIDPVNEIGTFLKQNKYLKYWVKVKYIFGGSTQLYNNFFHH